MVFVKKLILRFVGLYLMNKFDFIFKTPPNPKIILILKYQN